MPGDVVSAPNYRRTRRKGEHMGFMDKAKDALNDHGDKVDEGIDKAADIADDKTGGKYSGQIDAGAEKAKEVVDGLTDGADG